MTTVYITAIVVFGIIIILLVFALILYIYLKIQKVRFDRNETEKIDYFEMYRAACMNKQADEPQFMSNQNNPRTPTRPLPATPQGEIGDDSDFFDVYREQMMNNKPETENKSASNSKKTTPVPAPRKKFNINNSNTNLVNSREALNDPVNTMESKDINNFISKGATPKKKNMNYPEMNIRVSVDNEIMERVERNSHGPERMKSDRKIQAEGKVNRPRNMSVGSEIEQDKMYENYDDFMTVPSAPILDHTKEDYDKIYENVTRFQSNYIHDNKIDDDDVFFDAKSAVTDRSSIIRRDLERRRKLSSLELDPFKIQFNQEKIYANTNEIY